MDSPTNQQPAISVGDPVLGRTRVLAQPCSTCVLNPGNPMHLDPGRLRGLVDTALTRQSYIICHDTLPYGPYPHAAPAVCRGFYNRYDTTALHLARRLWGIITVPQPKETDTTVQPATTAAPVAASTRQATGPKAEARCPEPDRPQCRRRARGGPWRPAPVTHPTGRVRGRGGGPDRRPDYGVGGYPRQGGDSAPLHALRKLFGRQPRAGEAG
jgi:hypothetical protein